MSTRMLVIVALCAALGACEGEGNADAAADGRAFARVKQLHVRAVECAAEIGEALATSGFTVTDARHAQATLDVELAYTARDLDGLPNFRGMGTRASYDLNVRDSRGRVLVHTTGSADSPRTDDFCHDLGDNVAEGLRQRQHG